MKNIIKEMSFCQKCTNLKNNCSLINIYHDYNFCTKIPSMWTDWFKDIKYPLMIIGQDWGPYEDMIKLNNEYLNLETKDNWLKIINNEKSLTKRNLSKFLQESAANNNFKLPEDFLNSIFITNAIMCSRTGSNYRSNNINLKESTLNCRFFLQKQIDLIKPKIILTLGYYPLLSLSKLYNFKIENNLTKTIENYQYFKINNFIIIPLFHPAAQISKDKQLKQYNLIWKNFIP